MLATFKENCESFFLFKSEICYVKLYLFVIVCRIAMTIRRAGLTVLSIQFEL